MYNTTAKLSRNLRFAALPSKVCKVSKPRLKPQILAKAPSIQPVPAMPHLTSNLYMVQREERYCRELLRRNHVYPLYHAEGNTPL